MSQPFSSDVASSAAMNRRTVGQARRKCPKPMSIRSNSLDSELGKAVRPASSPRNPVGSTTAWIPALHPVGGYTEDDLHPSGAQPGCLVASLAHPRVELEAAAGDRAKRDPAVLGPGPSIGSSLPYYLVMPFRRVRRRAPRRHATSSSRGRGGEHWRHVGYVHRRC
jgi:hypothetical protein